MRIMLDTNILISAGLFPNDTVNRLIEYIVIKHELVLSNLIVDELVKVSGYEKFDRELDMWKFLQKLTFTEFKTPAIEKIDGVSIRDEDDYPILFSAIRANVDVFITGDKDFIECGVTSPMIMTMAEFDKYHTD